MDNLATLISFMANFCTIMQTLAPLVDSGDMCSFLIAFKKAVHL